MSKVTTLALALLLWSGAAIAQAGGGVCDDVTKPGADMDKVIADCTALLGSADVPVSRRAEVLNNRAIAQTRKHEADLALRDYDEAIKLAPDYANALFNRGVLYLEKQKYGSAIADFNHALALEPDFAEAYFNRASALAAAGKFDDAIRDYDRVMKLRPREQYPAANANALAGRGHAYLDKHDYKRAIDDLDAAIQLNPGTTDAFLVRANAYLHKKDYDRALLDYEHVLSMKPDNSEALYGRGFAKKQNGDVAGGEADMARAKLIDPNLGK